mgnify:CR=1 FL=1
MDEMCANCKFKSVAMYIVNMGYPISVYNTWNFVDIGDMHMYTSRLDKTEEEISAAKISVILKYTVQCGSMSSSKHQCCADVVL